MICPVPHNPHPAFGHVDSLVPARSARYGLSAPPNSSHRFPNGSSLPLPRAKESLPRAAAEREKAAGPSLQPAPTGSRHGARVSPPAAREIRAGCPDFQGPDRCHPLRLGTAALRQEQESADLVALRKKRRSAPSLPCFWWPGSNIGPAAGSGQI